MRMAASWCRIPRIDRMQGCGAKFAPNSGFPSDRVNVLDDKEGVAMS